MKCFDAKSKYSREALLLGVIVFLAKKKEIIPIKMLLSSRLLIKITSSNRIMCTGFKFTSPILNSYNTMEHAYHSSLRQAHTQPDQSHRDATSKKLPIHGNLSSQVLTIPNILTSSRILLTPVIGYLIWNEMHSHALTCFAFAAVTDLFDGYLARRWNQCTKIGAILDPIADKFLLTTCFIALYKANLMPYWLVGGFICRDVALMLGGAVIRYRSFSQQRPSLNDFVDFNQYPANEFEPTYVSKCNTALQCLLIVTHLATHNLTGIPSYDLSICSLHALTAATTSISMGQYALRARKSIILQANKKS